MHEHQDEMSEFERILHATEETLDRGGHEAESGQINHEADISLSDNQLGELLEDFALPSFEEDEWDDNDNDDDDKNVDESIDKNVPVITLKKKKVLFKKEDRLFSSTYDKLLNKAWKMAEEGRTD